ncbi:hypothetical protein AA0119_g12034 [Alternaria tenuissima]|uniref:Uncharacterized protein n=1 Tax=Alternaria tenuissima TaxID=119927 RepID=A0ABY0FVV0_9PLEO|nr:hypothetical protein AA0119_g12034 [Alternaria tenuissima]
MPRWEEWSDQAIRSDQWKHPLRGLKSRSEQQAKYEGTIHYRPPKLNSNLVPDSLRLYLRENRMAYPSNLSGKHGGGFDPNSNTSVQVPSSQQFYPTQSHHCGGGSYDPNNPTKPVVVVQHHPVSQLQPTFSPQTQATNYYQPYQQYHQPPPPAASNQPGFITQLCGCFK